MLRQIKKMAMDECDCIIRFDSTTLEQDLRGLQQSTISPELSRVLLELIGDKNIRSSPTSESSQSESGMNKSSVNTQFRGSPILQEYEHKAPVTGRRKKRFYRGALIDE